VGDASNRYDRNAEAHVRTTKQTLRSVPVPARATYAVGLLRDGALHLVPVHAAVQVRRGTPLRLACASLFP
jgi:hypothetical protein